MEQKCGSVHSFIFRKRFWKHLLSFRQRHFKFRNQ